MDRQALIRLNDLGVTFQRWGQTQPALININLVVMAGQWVKILGHNGSGKSTLLRVIAGQQDPTDGHVEILSPIQPADAMRFDSRLFYICQDPLRGTAEGLTLLQNLIVADTRLKADWYWPSRQRNRYFDLLSQFDLVPRANQLLHLFYGGERQQIALLIARLRNPQILLLDEPFSALDPARVSQCESLIGRMNAAGCTVLQVTHGLDRFSSDQAKTVILEHGRVLEQTLQAPSTEMKG
jgi:ABC-type uncharacterized transport system ATPase component